MIVLASTSSIRRQMLRQAGLQFKTARPPVDEDTIAAKLRAAGANVDQVALHLAEGKAVSVGNIIPSAYVIGADQMLECDGVWYDKPADLKAARQQLVNLRGKTHILATAVVLAHEGKMIWHQVERAQMTMRNFSDRFLDHYIDLVGDDICASVGAYQLEGAGMQLFEKVEGDYYTILGMPLLPLLGALRKAGALLA